MVGRVRSSLYEHAGREPALLAPATAHHARCLAVYWGEGGAQVPPGRAVPRWTWDGLAVAG